MLRCLGGSNADDGVTPLNDFEVLLLINNSRDATRGIAQRMIPITPFRLSILTLELPPAQANAGGARRAGMEEAAARLTMRARPGLILTTDADTRVSRDWIANTVAAFADGADAVAGQVSLAPEDELLLPKSLRQRGALEARYERLVCELYARYAPQRHDPSPRHAMESGATLAVTLKAYRQIGGCPKLPLGEDKALVAALQLHKLKVRHSVAVRVATSGRLVGRAVGGCADTMRARIDAPQTECDDTLEPAVDIVRRLLRTRSHIRPLVNTRRLRPSQLRVQIIIARLLLLFARFQIWEQVSPSRTSIQSAGSPEGVSADRFGRRSG